MYDPIKDQFAVANSENEFHEFPKEGYIPVPEPFQELVINHAKKGEKPKTLKDADFKRWRKQKRAKAKLQKKFNKRKKK